MPLPEETPVAGVEEAAADQSGDPEALTTESIRWSFDQAAGVLPRTEDVEARGLVEKAAAAGSSRASVRPEATPAEDDDDVVEEILGRP